MSTPCPEEERSFVSYEYSFPPFRLALEALSELPDLEKTVSSREWQEGSWPFNSDCEEELTIFSQGGETLVEAREKLDSCHGTMDDSYARSIRVSLSRPELASIVESFWESGDLP